MQGLPKKFDQKKILKVIKKKFACNGTIVEAPEMGEVIQLQGDQRKDVQEFLIDKKDGLGLDGKTIKVCKPNLILLSFLGSGFANFLVTGSWLLEPLSQCGTTEDNSKAALDIATTRQEHIAERQHATMPCLPSQPASLDLVGRLIAGVANHSRECTSREGY